MNTRVLGSKERSRNPSFSGAEVVRSPWDLSEAELVELEDQLLEDMEIQDMDEIEEDFDTFSELDE